MIGWARGTKAQMRSTGEDAQKGARAYRNRRGMCHRKGWRLRRPAAQTTSGLERRHSLRAAPRPPALTAARGRRLGHAGGRARQAP